MNANVVNAEPGDIERYIATHNALECLARKMAPMPDDAMNALVDAISVVKANILALLPISNDKIAAEVLAPFIGRLVEDAS
ncbi:hypothetical protein ACG873_06700 [Mesorhizobium sp. AaZ16]|uniref:hypothetical protein n=1 Tax=Mesorhizobium sp. AaZ16 TaxID=3402289 RepID=UPI00374FA4CA